MDYQLGLLVILFFSFSLLIGAGVRYCLKGTKIPYTIALFVIGLILGFSERFGLFPENVQAVNLSIRSVAAIDPHLILYLFLPTLIFESAFGLEVHLFRRMFSQILVLAVPGLIFATFVTAFLVRYLLPWHWNWPICLLFGALISATDPVAVVALLREVSSRKRLETLIDGESLLNDGTAIVLFTLFYGLIVNNSPLPFFNITFSFVWIVSVGLLLGLLFGFIATRWIGKVFNDPSIEITVTIAVAYLTFFIAENIFHVSGVVAVVALALYMAGVGRTKFAPEVTDFLHHFWQMMAFIANTIIFLLVGIIITTKINIQHYEYWPVLFLLYIGIMLIRTITIILFSPILKNIGIGFNKEKAIILIWGGLRGAVAMALALAVVQHAFIDRAIGEQILFLSAGIVMLTLLINGITLHKVFKIVKLDHLPFAKEISIKKARMKVNEASKKLLEELRKNEFLQEANWSLIETMLKLSIVDLDKETINIDDLVIDCKRRLLETERKNYWNQFEIGLLGRNATKKLVDSVEYALDGIPVITPRPTLHLLSHFSKFIYWLRKIPLIDNIIMTSTTDRIALGYDVTRGFIHAQNEMANYVETFAPSVKILKSIKEDINANKTQAYLEVNELKSNFPELLANIETKAAIRMLLNHERSIIHNLVKSGVLEEPEAKRMIEDIEKRMQQVRKLN